jgi:HSP20 family molecular chaperone IbpA
MNPICPFRMNRRELFGMLQSPSILDLLLAEPTGLHFPRKGRDSVSDAEKSFSINLDFSAFKPEEVKIVTTGGLITITAGHEETDETLTHLSRHVKHVYRLPKDVDPKTIKSALNAEGILTVKAEKRAIEPRETAIAIEHQPE